MSYILEALKKAEQKREQEEPSKVPTFLTGMVREAGKRAKWPYVVAAALILNAGLVVWRLVPRQAPSALPPTTARTLVGAAPEAALPARVKETRKPAPLASPPKETPVFIVSTAPAKAPSVAEAAPLNPPIRVENPQSSSPGKAVPVVSPPETSPGLQIRVPKAKPVASGKLFALNDLPSSIRSALPEFRVSGHAYTPEPQTRVVRINEKILQEGQDLAPGLRVEEIVQSGIIMTYEGYRFRIPIKEPN
jgi:general secretion pathway protein B